MRLCRPPPRRVTAAPEVSRAESQESTARQGDHDSCVLWLWALDSPLLTPCPCQESNLVYDLRKVACFQYTSRTNNTHPRSRTLPCGFEDRRASATLVVQSCQWSVVRGPLSRRFSTTDNGLRTGQHKREDSNPMRQFWRLLALPGARSCGSRETRVERQEPKTETDVCLPLALDS